MVRGVLFALVLAGCYSPSFDTCSLACANEACPNGYECSNGRCAIEGSTCTPMIDGGDDGMPIDNNTANCGNDASQPGEVCFEPALVLDVGLANIADAQFVDGNGDGTLDIGFLAPVGYFFRLRMGGTLESTNTTGPILPTANVFVPKNLDGDMEPELVHDNNVDDQIEVFDWGSSWTEAANLATEGSAAVAIAVGRTTGPTGSDSIAALYVNRLRVFQLPADGTSLAPLTQSQNAFQVSGARDLGIADTEGDNVGEIAVARTAAIDIFKNTGASISVFAMASVASVDSIEGCNVDGGNDGEFVYAIRSQMSANGTVGALRRTTSNNYEISATRSIPSLFGSLACTDIDKDGFADAIVSAGDGGGNQSILVLRGRADNTFEAPISFPIENAVSHIHVGDFNGDDVPDIITTSSQPGIIQVLLSNP